MTRAGCEVSPRPAALSHFWSHKRLIADCPRWKPKHQGRTGRGQHARPARQGSMSCRPAARAALQFASRRCGPCIATPQGSRPGCAANGPGRAGAVFVDMCAGGLITEPSVMPCIAGAAGVGWPRVRGECGHSAPRITRSHLGSACGAGARPWRLARYPESAGRRLLRTWPAGRDTAAVGSTTRSSGHNQQRTGASWFTAGVALSPGSR